MRDGWIKGVRLLAAGVIAASAMGAMAAPASADPALLVTDNLEGLFRIDPDTGNRMVVGEIETGTVYSGVAVAADGTIFVTDIQATGLIGSDGQIWRINPLSGAATLLSSNSAPAGGPQLADPRGIAVAPDGSLLVADPIADTGGSGTGELGALIRVDPVSGARTAVFDNIALGPDEERVRPAQVAVDSSGTIYVAEDQAEGSFDNILRIGSDGTKTPVASVTDAEALVAEPGGTLLVTETGAVQGEDPFGEDIGSIVRVDPATGTKTPVSSNAAPAGSPEFRLPFAIALDPTGTRAFVTDHGAGSGSGSAVLGVDVASGARSLVADTVGSSDPDLFFNEGIAYEPNAPAFVNEACEQAKQQKKKAAKQLKKAKQALDNAKSKAAKKKAAEAVVKAKKKLKKAKAAVAAAC